jgi:hypothetical protein
MIRARLGFDYPAPQVPRRQTMLYRARLFRFLSLRLGFGNRCASEEIVYRSSDLGRSMGEAPALMHGTRK